MEVWHLLIALVYIISAIVFFKTSNKYDWDLKSIEIVCQAIFLFSSVIMLLALVIHLGIFLIENINWSWLTHKLF